MKTDLSHQNKRTSFECCVGNSLFRVVETCVKQHLTFDYSVYEEYLYLFTFTALSPINVTYTTYTKLNYTIRLNYTWKTCTVSADVLK